MVEFLDTDHDDAPSFEDIQNLAAMNAAATKSMMNGLGGKDRSELLRATVAANNNLHNHTQPQPQQPSFSIPQVAYPQPQYVPQLPTAQLAYSQPSIADQIRSMLEDKQQNEKIIKFLSSIEDRLEYLIEKIDKKRKPVRKKKII